MSELRKAGNTYAREVEMSDRVPTYKDFYKHPKIALLEVTSSETTVTNEAATYGLTALEPFSQTDENATAALHGMIAKFVPTFVVCHGTYDSTSEAHETRVRACLEQEHQGRYFLFELKPGDFATSTAAEYTKDLLDHKNVTTVECDLGAYGLEDEDGLPSSSRSLWATNHRDMAKRLGKKADRGAAPLHPTPWTFTKRVPKLVVPGSGAPSLGSSAD